MSFNESSVTSKLLDLYDELALDLDELAAFACLLGNPNDVISREIRPGLQGLLERIHHSIKEKHQVIGKLHTELHEGGAA